MRFASARLSAASYLLLPAAYRSPLLALLNTASAASAASSSHQLPAPLNHSTVQAPPWERPWVPRAWARRTAAPAPASCRRACPWASAAARWAAAGWAHSHRTQRWRRVRPSGALSREGAARAAGSSGSEPARGAGAGSLLVPALLKCTTLPPAAGARVVRRGQGGALWVAQAAFVSTPHVPRPPASGATRARPCCSRGGRHLWRHHAPGRARQRAQLSSPDGCVVRAVVGSWGSTAHSAQRLLFMFGGVDHRAWPGTHTHGLAASHFSALRHRLPAASRLRDAADWSYPGSTLTTPTTQATG